MHKKLLISLLLYFTATQTLISQMKFNRMINPTSYNIDSLQKEYGNRKEFISDLELQCLIALSGYPELKDEQITFKYHHIKSSGETTLKFASVFKKKHRHYIMYINNDASGKIVLLQNAPVNAQIGVIAHELAHVVDFKKRSTGGLIHWGLNYLSKKKRERCEKTTDSVAICHGFGWQLYDWIDFVLNSSTATEKYKAFKKRFYLQPHEILKMIEPGYR